MKVGVIGLGEQAWDNLLPSLAMIRNCRIVALCDKDDDKVNDATKAYGGKGYVQFQEMILNEQLDAVIVASYPQVHEEVLEMTIAYGIPTFVEKPPTVTTVKLKRLIERNRKFKTITAVGLNFNFTEAFRFIEDASRRPEFGTVRHIRVNHYGAKPTQPLWGLDSTLRSFLLAQAIHPLGMLLNFGELTSAKPMVHSFNNDEGMFIGATITLRDTEGGLINAQVNTTSMAPFFRWELELITSTGVIITVNSLWETKLFSKHRSNTMIENQKWWHDSWSPSPLSNGFKRTGYEHQFRHFFECIENGESNSTALENILPIYKLMDFIEEQIDE